MTKDNRLATEKHMAAAKAVDLILLGKAKTKNKTKNITNLKSVNMFKILASKK